MVACFHLPSSVFNSLIKEYFSFQCFVIFVTMVREAVDDFRRFRRDREMNSTKYKKVTKTGVVMVPSSKIKVGDLIVVEKVRFQGFFKSFRRSTIL
jgi:phospholipid-translocating ATPase